MRKDWEQIYPVDKAENKDLNREDLLIHIISGFPYSAIYSIFMHRKEHVFLIRLEDLATPNPPHKVWLLEEDGMKVKERWTYHKEEKAKKKIQRILEG